jgi:hypothetical protein
MREEVTGEGGGGWVRGCRAGCSDVCDYRGWQLCCMIRRKIQGGAKPSCQVSGQLTRLRLNNPNTFEDFFWSLWH